MGRIRIRGKALKPSWELLSVVVAVVFNEPVAPATKYRSRPELVEGGAKMLGLDRVTPVPVEACPEPVEGDSARTEKDGRVNDPSGTQPLHVIRTRR